MKEEIKVEAFDYETGESCGVFQSIYQAAKKLYIRKASTIWHFLFGLKGMTFKGNKKGVKSYKNDKKYTFKVIQ